MNLKVSIFAFSLIFIIGCGKSTTENALVYLEQGWTKENEFRELFYYTSQGSRLIPYKWFLALEQSDNEGMFRDPKFIASLGFLNHRPPKEEVLKVYQDLNPDRLPVGFVKDPPGAVDGWLGFTCAACHTGQINYKGKEIRIDGGPSMADLQTFLRRMRDSIKATLNEEAKFDRFAKKVKSPNKDDLRKELKEFSKTFSELVDRNKSPELPYGFARLDAFGAILNKVAYNLDKTAEPLLSNAPVSYPFIWDTPKLDWVQWNGAIDNPISRNAGEVVGVYGEITPDNETLFSSSARLNELFLLEEWVKVLDSPKWPEHYLGKIDTDKKNKGEIIYKNGGKKDQAKKYKGCEDCHSLPASDSRMTDPNENFAGKSFIKTHVVGLDKIGTDRMVAEKFAGSKIVVGPMAGILSSIIKSKLRKPLKPEDSFCAAAFKSILRKPLKPEDSFCAAVVLATFVELTTKKGLDSLSDEDYVKYTGYHRLPPNCKKNKDYDCDKKPPKSPSRVEYGFLAYKARPLNGIWATAPYLHNGSVPNLYQLLSPSERSEKFCVGSREFDPEKVGFEFEPKNGSCGENFTFDTTKEGNRNTGHNFSKDLSIIERENLLEFLKTL